MPYCILDEKFICAVCGYSAGEKVLRNCHGKGAKHARALTAEDVPCMYRLGSIRTENIRRCGGTFPETVYGCCLHGECVLRPLPKMQACLRCRDLKMPD